MNSFSYELKTEVAKILPNGADESLSELSAIIKTCGEISKNNNEWRIVIFTEVELVKNLVKTIIKKIYGKDVIEELTSFAFSKKGRYKITLPSAITSQVLLDTEIMQLDENKYLEFFEGISHYVAQDQSNELAFLRGAFVGAFSCNISVAQDSVNKANGYHAEFVFTKEAFAQDFCFLLADFDIISKMTPRKSAFVVYVKGLDMICDLLTIVGATQGSLKLQNEGVFRSIRNNVNRQTNCINANLTKTVDASVRELDAIKKINNSVGLETLDEALQDVAYLRLANPEESLDSLVKLSTKPISKSGLYHRLKKIEKIASQIKWFFASQFFACFFVAR